MNGVLTSLACLLPAACRTAAAAYAEQTRSAIASVQREYGLPMPGSSNVFCWSCRPDVRAVRDIMCGYIKEWDYRQVRALYTETGKKLPVTSPLKGV
jgi:hypothetical protein